MPKTETVLFTIDKQNICRLGLPPTDPNDKYTQRANDLGILANYSHVFFSPKGHMFVVRGDKLFKGQAPVNPWKDKDWFSLAKCVGRSSWDQYRFLYFRSDGKLFAVTNSGAWYKGPEPENEHVPWIYKTATKIGDSRLHDFDALCFDPDNIMYGVYDGELRRNSARSKTDGRWFDNSIKVGNGGWDKLSYFVGFSSNGNLWCVSHDGAIYKGDPPTDQDFPWIERASKMGTNYNEFKKLSFTEDKTIVKILSLDFLTDVGKVLSMEPEAVSEKVFDNRNSRTPLKSTFEIDKVYAIESEFSHEHGMEFSMEAEITFEAGLPAIANTKSRIAVKAGTSHKWNFVEKNKTETTFKMISEFEVEPGKAVRQIAVIKKAEINIPYTSEVLTLFGYKTTISGTWKGCTFFDLKIKQVDQ